MPKFFSKAKVIRTNSGEKGLPGKIFEFVRGLPRAWRSSRGTKLYTGVEGNELVDVGKFIGRSPRVGNHRLFAAGTSERLAREHPELMIEGRDIGLESAKVYADPDAFWGEAPNPNGRVYRVFDMTPEEEVLRLPHPSEYGAVLYQQGKLPFDRAAYLSRGVAVPVPMGGVEIRNGKMSSLLGKSPLFPSVYAEPGEWKIGQTDRLADFVKENGMGKSAIYIPDIADAGVMPFDEMIFLGGDRIFLGKPDEGWLRSYARSVFKPNIPMVRRGGTVESKKDTARLARLFGFDGRRGAL